MTDHQKRLWQEMIKMIDRYLDGSSTNFAELVGMLEGTLDAAELHDMELQKQWYIYWTPLEIRRSVGESEVSRDEVSEELKSMRSFLEEHLPKGGFGGQLT